MKKILFLLLFPSLALAQYQGNANQKITLGEQTTADGLVYRGLVADTTRKPSVDTMAYIILDTTTNLIWHYKKGTSNAWLQAGGGVSVTSFSAGTTGLTPSTATTGAVTLGGTLAVANGGTGTSIGSITGSDSLLFAAGGSNKNIRVTPSGTGNFVVTNGNIVLANNAGIDFGATNNSSGTMQNELLDDYEEGTATVSITCGAGTITLSGNTAKYTKIGRVVNLQGFFAVSAISSPEPTGRFNLIGFPFTQTSNGRPVGVAYVLTTDAFTGFPFVFGDGGSGIYIDRNQADGSDSKTDFCTYIKSTSEIFINVTYKTDQ